MFYIIRHATRPAAFLVVDDDGNEEWGSKKAATRFDPDYVRTHRLSPRHVAGKWVGPVTEDEL
jgi:hypothetical protein